MPRIRGLKKTKSKGNSFLGKIKKSILVVVMVCLFGMVSVNYASASILVSAPKTVASLLDQTKTNIANWAKDFSLTKFYQETLKTAGSEAAKSALGSAVKQIAYDTATWIGSGGEGQQPMFIREGWGEYMKNIGDNAAGEFLEELGRNEDFFGQFNLCEPDFQLKAKIGLGLASQYRRDRPACTFSEMRDNWEEELERGDFLVRFQNMFQPQSNDLTRALTIQTGILQRQQEQELAAQLERLAGGNSDWLSKRDAAGRAESPPGYAQTRMETTWLSQKLLPFSKEYENEFVEAAHIFVNQLAVTLFENLMGTIGKSGSTYTSSYDGDHGLSNFESGTAGAGGIDQAESRFRQLAQPDFSVRGDYRVLGELTMCPDSQDAGPTECVITDNFRQAVENKLTVAEAVEQGYLDENGVFGFLSGDNLEPKYNEGYPYRSMLILRKFRIIPVGWELAAQYIGENSDSTGTCNLGDMLACYHDSGYEYHNNACDLGDRDWCDDLVDPNWVLKAPLNYCRREGPGPEIMSERVVGKGDDSELSVSRKDNYCADEQTCIKENYDGSCEAYGYCTEERRTWNFDSQSCDPLYNTCQTFQAEGGRTVSYLTNNIDYDLCSADNAGCSDYCSSYNYTQQSFNCTGAGDWFFDSDIQACGSQGEGCSEFIRTQDGQDANLYPNSSFESSVDYLEGGVRTLSEDAPRGRHYLQYTAGTILPSPLHESGMVAFSDETAEWYTLSLYARNCTGQLQLGSDLGIPGRFSTVELAGSDNRWQRYQVSHLFRNDNQIEFRLTDGCDIDAIKLERGQAASAYSEYRENGLVYERLLPDYLHTYCYDGGSYDYRPDAPAVCSQYARLCNEDDVGCRYYTSLKSRIEIPAQVSATDYCPQECAGYDNYQQTASMYSLERTNYFIPSTAQKCGVQSAGCDEFTNLDRVGDPEEGESEMAYGAEAREYYSYLRQCVKPDNGDCATFYTWEGSDESGYQLKVFELRENTAGDGPFVTSDDSGECSEAIYNYEPTNPAYNPDCREFYSSSGDVSYHLYSRTVSCSDNCHPYRRTEINSDPEITTEGACGPACTSNSANGQARCWDASVPGEEFCVFCQNGGEWNTEHGACIYMGIPDEGIKCSASQAGCREYTGSQGNNIREIINSSFEGSYGDWEGYDGSTLALSNVSLRAGEQSLEVTGGNLQLRIGTAIRKDRSYVVRFLARSQTGGNAIDRVYFGNGEGFADSNFELDREDDQNANELEDDWRIYEYNLASLSPEFTGQEARDFEVTAEETFNIEAGSTFFIDDIRLIEVTDRYYLIQDSWQTPESCGQDIFGNPVGAMHNLGCAGYRTDDGETHYLRRFSRLCQDSAVGCELMVDTQNSTLFSDDRQTFNLTNQDSLVYAVYDEDKACDAADKGCQLFGESYHYMNDVVFRPVYLLNNPDEYERIICLSDEAGCQEWSTNEGVSYFKDPGEQVCQWRQGGENAGSDGWGWYRKKVKRCGGGGEYCLDDSDCGGQISCVLEEGDSLCSVSEIMTIGYGNGRAIGQPVDDNHDWVGLCPAGEAGCTEYIDPISQASANLLSPDGWSGSRQNVSLKPNTLYIVGGGSLSVSGCSGCYSLDTNTNLMDSFQLTGGNGGNNRLFLTGDSPISVAVTDRGGGADGYLREAMIDYQLEQNVDKQSCNGQVDFSDGCILFNERSQEGEGKRQLDADASTGNLICSGSACDSNTLIKVRPDRVCDEWLACRSAVIVKNDSGEEQNYCFDVGACNQMNDNGNCSNFVYFADGEEQVYSSGISDISNRTGYYKAAYNAYDSSGNFGAVPDNLYHLGAMEQVGNISYLPNGDFEFYDENFYPLGWTPQSSEEGWTPNDFYVVSNPVKAQEIDVDYPVQGRAFLSYSGSYGGETRRELVGPENAPPNIEDINAAVYYNNLLTLIDDRNYYRFNGTSWSSGTLNSVWGDDINSPQNYSDIRAAWYYDGTVWFVDSTHYYRFTLGTGEWDVPMPVWSEDLDGQYSPNDYGMINSAWMMGAASDRLHITSNEDANNGDSDSWYIWNYADIPEEGEEVEEGESPWMDPAVARPELDGSNSLVQAWTGNSLAPQPEQIPNIRASWNEGDNLYVLVSDGTDHMLFSYEDGRFSGSNGLFGWGYNWQDTFLDKSPRSENIDVEAGAEYVLSFQINTKDLKSETGNISGAGNEARAVVGLYYPGDDEPFHTVTTDIAEDWSVKVSPFTPLENRIFVRLASEGDNPIGNVYIDDITIRPALEVNDDWDIRQTCRLYPQDDSLACEYYEDSGQRQKGLYGYCLEYDRYPGSSDSCLLWYPVDRVKGDGIDENAGYHDRYPLYYATEHGNHEERGRRSTFTLVNNPYAEMYIPVSSLDFGSGSLNPDSFAHNVDFVQSVIMDNINLELNESNNYSACYERYRDGLVSFEYCWDRYFSLGNDCRDAGEWTHGRVYGLRARMNGDEFEGIDIYGCDTSGHYESGDSTQIDSFSVIYQIPYATEIVQTVTPMGQNKYWSGRVSQGSSYVSLPSQNVYGTDHPPFGSVFPPDPVENPSEWDGNDDVSHNQPLYGLLPPNTPRSGQGMTSVDEVRMLFAKGYASWEWNGSQYIRTDNTLWNPPTNLCENNGIPPRPQQEMTFHVQQPSGVDMELPATFVTSETPNEFYDYQSSSFANHSFRQFIQPHRAVLFIQYSQATERYNLGIFFDYPDSIMDPDLDEDGGHVRFTFDYVTPGIRVVVEDDPGESNLSPGSPCYQSAGSEACGNPVDVPLQSGDQWGWAWNSCCTDGGMIEMPDGDWSITIDPEFIDGITDWDVVYDDNGSIRSQSLDMEEPVTLSYDYVEAGYCAISPRVDTDYDNSSNDIRINGVTSSFVDIHGTGFVELEFNTLLDSQQLPLTMITVDWGDGEETVISGVELRDRPNFDDPHSFYHMYDYRDMVAKDICSGSYCVVRPRIKIKDNWGWCNGGSSGNSCPAGSFERFQGSVRVYPN